MPSSTATDTDWVMPVIIPLINNTEYVTGFNFAAIANHSGTSSSGKSAGLSIKSGMPRKLTIPQNVSCDFAVAAITTEIPEKPSEKRITIIIIGIIINGLTKLTPIASAIPKIKLACNVEIKEIANILPSAIDDLEIGDVRALFMNPYLLSQRVFTPPNMLVKIAVRIMTPGVINSTYDRS